jgi:hypothetical protein
MESLKKQLAGIEKDEKSSKKKLDRLLNLYLEGKVAQASYVVKSSELEAEAQRLSHEVGPSAANSESRETGRDHRTHPNDSSLIPIASTFYGRTKGKSIPILN